VLMTKSPFLIITRCISVVIITVSLNMSMMILQSGRTSRSSGQLSGIVFRRFLIQILTRKPCILTCFLLFLTSSEQIPEEYV
jgi:hypothetical protein